ncbi:MAG: hypothetical protein ACTSRI_20465 [Promethearchaeota archaeon]
MELSILDIIQGIENIIFVITAFILGFIIIKKYFILKKTTSKKKYEFISLGLTLIFITSGWWGSVIVFLVSFVNVDIPDNIYIFSESIGVSLALFLWCFSFGKIYYHGKYHKKIILIFGIICSLYEIFIISAFLMDYTLIGVRSSMFYIDYSLIVVIFLLFSMITELVMGYLFFIETRKSDDNKIKMKGKFLLIAFILFPLAILIDIISNIMSIQYLEIINVFGKILLVLSGFSFYFGFLLPNRIYNFLNRD